MILAELSKEIHHATHAPGSPYFRFCCYTGLANADFKMLTTDEITLGIDGKRRIWTNRQKTDTASRIPLLPPALEIMDRHKDDPQCLNQGRVLPVSSNQKIEQLSEGNC